MDTAVKERSRHTGEPWFTGYETEPRWMRLTASGTATPVCPGRAPAACALGAPHADAFRASARTHGVGADRALKIPQVEVGGRMARHQGPVQLGAALVRDLVKAGL